MDTPSINPTPPASRSGLWKVIIVIFIVIIILASLAWAFVKKSAPDSSVTIGSNQTNQTQVSSGPYSLLQTTNNLVIRINTGAKGEQVWLLENPQFVNMGGTQIPQAPQNPQWAAVPDGSYKMLTGQTYVFKNSQIRQVLDRNGRDITGPAN